MNAGKLTFPLLLAAALMLVAGGASAQFTTESPSTSVDRSFDPSPKDCADVRWSAAAVRAFPSIADACQGVEQRNGKSFVKFEGVVESVKDQGKRIRVDFDEGEDLTFQPAAQTVLYLDGERTSFSEVRDGMRLNFYVPEDRLQAEFQPDPNRVAFIIFPLNISAAPIPETTQSVAGAGDENRDTLAARSELPETASAWPLVGASAVALLLFASFMALRRKQR